METLNKSKVLIYSDCNYTHAVNYRHLYNAPVTLNFGDKHNRTKYILSAGSSDSITLLKDGIFIYVVSENFDLSYCSLQIVNTETKEIEGEVYLNESDCTNEGNMSFGILELSSEEQLKTMLEYID